MTVTSSPGHEAADLTAVVYPDSDGQPMADNTKQFRWIVLLKTNLDHIVEGFVAGDLLWYPVEGHPKIRMAPDVLVAPDRPKGDRGSYRQWVEGGSPPKVVFEVLSPSNTVLELAHKAGFYHRYGAEELIVIDPETEEGWALVAGEEGETVEVPQLDGWTSPALGIRFARGEAGLEVFGPDGRAFLSFEALADRAEREADRAEREADRAEREADRAEREADRAEREAARADRLAAKLAALGVDPDEV